MRNVYNSYRAKYDIDPDFSFADDGIKFEGEGDIVAGKDSYIGRHSRIVAQGNTAVRIGDGCAISHNVMMYTQSRVADQDLSTSETAISEGDITIGNDVWIGANVFITEGVSIGDNAVVGANSVVTGDVPPHSIAAGTPARVQKFKHYLDDSTREELAVENWQRLSETLRKELPFEP